MEKETQPHTEHRLLCFLSHGYADRRLSHLGWSLFSQHSQSCGPTAGGQKEVRQKYFDKGHLEADETKSFLAQRPPCVPSAPRRRHNPSLQPPFCPQSLSPSQGGFGLPAPGIPNSQHYGAEAVGSCLDWTWASLITRLVLSC